ncbi:MAG TPA: TIM44-like domain-containing protein [Gemmataceae bacterium]|nr:TIM44-like domain-containing protein [Gemmataceae bacterium]
MRLFTALAFCLVLFVASPAHATLGQELDSEQQTQGYGRIFAFVCAALSVIAVLIVATHVIKGMIAESKRGKKSGRMPETILDDAPPMKKQALYLGEKVPDWKFANRRAATAAALQFITRNDDWFDQEYITRVVDKAFRAIKEAIEVRSVKKIEKYVTANCLEELQSEMSKLKKKGDLHLFGQIEITDVQVVQLQVPAQKLKHTFIALISAKSRDFYQDDKTGELLRGDRKTYAYQEFWTFKRSKERWLVESIRTSSDMDNVLAAKNLMTQTDLDKFARKADPEHVREFVPG